MDLTLFLIYLYWKEMNHCLDSIPIHIIQRNKLTSTRGNSCCQVFVSDRSFVALYPMKSQTQFQDALHWFCKQVGVPQTLVVDSHKSQTSNQVKRFCDQIGTVLRILETETQWANRAELYIGLLKEAIRKDLQASD